jgi:hypothetical protein
LNALRPMRVSKHTVGFFHEHLQRHQRTTALIRIPLVSHQW